MPYLPSEVPFHKQTLALIKCILSWGYCRKEEENLLHYFPLWTPHRRPFQWNTGEPAGMCGSRCQRQVESSVRKDYALLWRWWWRLLTESTSCSSPGPLHRAPPAALRLEQAPPLPPLPLPSHSPRPWPFSHSGLHGCSCIVRPPLPHALTVHWQKKEVLREHWRAVKGGTSETLYEESTVLGCPLSEFPVIGTKTLKLEDFLLTTQFSFPLTSAVSEPT